MPNTEEQTRQVGLSPATAVKPTRLIIDCDPGIDDAVSIALAVGSPELEILGITTVAGNVGIQETTTNALGLLAAFGRDEIPVAAGAHRGLVRTKADHRFVHGENGIGGVDLAPARRTVNSEHAVDFLSNILSRHGPRSVTIAAIGPLTNIAMLLALRPELIDNIEELVIMGATAGGGNITPVAEYNTWADPEAAQRVFTTVGLKIRLLELQITRRATVDQGVVATMRAESPRGDLLADMIDGYEDRTPDGQPLHDALAIAAIVDPTLIETRPASVEVNTHSDSQRAETVFDFGPAAANSNLQVAVEFDLKRFRELLIARVAGPVQGE